jgi:hypothetical protein
MSFLQKFLNERSRIVRLAARGDFLLIGPVSAACSDPNHHFALVTAITLQALPDGSVLMQLVAVPTDLVTLRVVFGSTITCLGQRGQHQALLSCRVIVLRLCPVFLYRSGPGCSDSDLRFLSGMPWAIMLPI